MSYATPEQWLTALAGDAGKRANIILPVFADDLAKIAFLQSKLNAASARIDGILQNHYAVPIDLTLYPAAAELLRELCIQMACKLLSPGFDVTLTDFGAPYSAIEAQTSRMVGAWRFDGAGNPTRYPPLEQLPGVPRIA